eukprot:5322498-Alexandrium_andersonii.AAC.1
MSRTRQRERECGRRLIHQRISARCQHFRNHMSASGVCACLCSFRCQHIPCCVCTRYTIAGVAALRLPSARAHVAWPEWRDACVPAP